MSDGLCARNLACMRGERMLFSGLDLDLGPGEFVELTGPNGSGKSTLLRALSGLGAAVCRRRCVARRKH